MTPAEAEDLTTGTRVRWNDRHDTDTNDEGTVTEVNPRFRQFSVQWDREAPGDLRTYLFASDVVRTYLEVA